MININKVNSESLVMKKIFIIAIFMLLSAITLFSQTCEWAEKIGGNGFDEIHCIVTDNNGNIFVAGEFNSDTIIFNNGKFLKNSGNGHGYIAKYNNDGTCLWAEKIEGKGYDYVNGIILDSNGNIFIAGSYYFETINFNNGKYLTNSGYGDGYIAKYNSSGICQWADKISGNYHEGVATISIDDFDNIYVSGNFESDTLFFNNGKYVTHFRLDDSFIAKYNNNGICQWAEKITGNKYDYIYSLNIDEFGDVFITGIYDSDTIMFNNDKYLKKSNKEDGFLAKYNRNGICEWVENIPRHHPVVLQKDNIFIGGFFGKDTINFNNGTSLTSNDYNDGFIAKYNNNGKCQWVEQIKGTREETANSITVDADENIYVIGTYNGDSLFFNNGIFLSKKYNTKDYVAKYNGIGICQWAEQIVGPFSQYSNQIAVDNFGSIYISGAFQSDTIKFNNGISIIGFDVRDSYLAKYSQSNTSISDKPIQNNIAVYPNPAYDYIEINPDANNPTLKRGVDEGSDIQIFNTLGEIIISVEQTPPSVQRIDISKLSHGIYFIKIGNRVEKFVKM